MVGKSPHLHSPLKGKVQGSRSPHAGFAAIGPARIPGQGTQGIRVHRAGLGWGTAHPLGRSTGPGCG